MDTASPLLGPELSCPLIHESYSEKSVKVELSSYKTDLLNLAIVFKEYSSEKRFPSNFLESIS